MATLFLCKTLRNLLEVCVVRSAGEGDNVADVGHTGHEEQQTLEAEAEA